ncbi:MAG: ABC transporter permease [Calditrichia bacterium]
MPIKETVKMAVQAIVNHKLRSFLTLVGIIAGVASIIGVMTGISVMQRTIEKEMSVLGNQTFQVQKWAVAGPLSQEERRKIMKRRPITVEQANAIRERVKSVDLVGAELWDWGHQASYRDKSTNPDLTLCGGTPEYSANNTHFIELGRNLTHEDVKVGRNVVVLGYAVAEKLFPWIDPVGKTVKIDGRKFRVVGVLEKKNSALGGSFDKYLIIPITTFQRIYGNRDERGKERSVNVTVRARTPELVNTAIEETRMVLRQVRELKPQQEDDFTIYTNDSQIKTFNRITAGIKMAAFLIGTIALVVAGIGIMNIMLVSVTERTKEIGIRKSLGARKADIRKQFLMEAIILSNIGGVIGVLVGFGLGNLLSIFTDFTAVVPLEWAIIGLVFCSLVGLIFGYWPAAKASRLHPIESLRFE